VISCSTGAQIPGLTLVDNYSRECREIEVGQNLKGIDVVVVMDRMKASRGVVPKRIECDNGSEFISKALDNWAHDNQVTLECVLSENHERSIIAGSFYIPADTVPRGLACEAPVQSDSCDKSLRRCSDAA
jgi:integrase-like protein